MKHNNINAGIYIGTLSRQGWRDRTVKIGESQDLNLRQYQLTRSIEYNNYRHIATYTPENATNKPTRLLYESAIRYVLSKELRHSGNDRLQGDMHVDNLINKFYATMEAVDRFIVELKNIANM